MRHEIIKSLYLEIKDRYESCFEDTDAESEESCQKELLEKQNELKKILEYQNLIEIFDVELIDDNSWAIFTYNQDYISLIEVINSKKAKFDEKSKRWFVPCDSKKALSFFVKTSKILGY